MMTFQEFKAAAETYLANNPTYSGWQVSVTEEVGFELTWRISLASPQEKGGGRCAASTTQTAATATLNSPTEIIDSLAAMLTIPLDNPK